MPLEKRVIIQIEHLIKKFGRACALNDLDLRIERGNLVTILGPNGAGKTTLLRVLATLSKPSDGRVLLNGQDLIRDAATIRAMIGMLPHQVLLYGQLTANENLYLYAKLYGIPSIKSRIEECLEIAGIPHLRHVQTQILSRGMQQRLAIARTILHDPDILLLDEPYTGLDQQAVQHLDSLLKALHAQGKTILMTTHAIDRLKALDTDIIILAQGRLIFSASRSALQETNILSLYENTLRNMNGRRA